jgi:hypothetical protein
MRIGQSIPEIQAFFEIQYGGRQPSWIPNNANYEVTLKKQSFFGCVREISCELINPFPNYAILSKSNMAVSHHLGFPKVQLST